DPVSVLNPQTGELILGGPTRNRLPHHVLVAVVRFIDNQLHTREYDARIAPFVFGRQAPVRSEIDAQKLPTPLEEQHTERSQHWEHDEVASNRPPPYPPTKPTVDQPVQQPQGPG